MIIPERLSVEAGRIGNATMIAEILKDRKNTEKYELLAILPNRQGIIIYDENKEKQILIKGSQIKLADISQGTDSIESED